MLHAINFVIISLHKRLDGPLISSSCTKKYLCFHSLQIPTFGFLYVAGWIGYVGRIYLNKIRTEPKPTEKEIIIDVPAALRIIWQGLTWPVAVVAELKAGTLTEKDQNITVSPR